jgi:hypothetical protein
MAVIQAVTDFKCTGQMEDWHWSAMYTGLHTVERWHLAINRHWYETGTVEPYYEVISSSH